MTTAAELTKVARKLGVTLARRDELVCQMRDEGATLREIAAAANLTAPGVARIIERRSPCADPPNLS